MFGKFVCQNRALFCQFLLNPACRGNRVGLRGEEFFFHTDRDKAVLPYYFPHILCKKFTKKFIAKFNGGILGCCKKYRQINGEAHLRSTRQKFGRKIDNLYVVTLINNFFYLFFSLP